ncbi:MAG: phosphoribosylanthranilate isomerase [Alphaproteobacteria bacterium]|jgi:phosphoribosylanthranilate isomerase|nr:phosphoribosylanthranilate isomerase [Alphaproteobacteria bacterium]
MVEVKICGLNTSEAVAAAHAGGASHIGFIFYPPSPRAVSPERAGEIAKSAPPTVARVAVFVDPTDAEIEAVVAALAPTMLQLHGSETPERVREVKQRFGLAVMKAIRVSTVEDIQAATVYDGIADALLFDAKPPKNAEGMLPGGNGLAFDWTLLATYKGKTPWFLSGGLDMNNLAQAMEISGAQAIDLSSGVEDRPGVKNVEKIGAFLRAVKG